MLFLAGTTFVLFQDVLEGAPVTTGHVLTALALVAATAAGHWFVPVLRSGRVLSGLGLATLALAGLIYIAISSGARNAEVANAKALRIVAAEAERAQILPAKVRAEAMLQAALAEVAKECGSGKGMKCEGRKATVEVYRAAIKGHDADLARIGPPQTPNVGYKAAADVLAALGIASDEAATEKKLATLMPWLAVLIVELGTILFLGLGIGHRRSPSATTRMVVTANNDETPRRLALPPASASSQIDDVTVVTTALRRAGRPLNNTEMGVAMGVVKSEATKRVQAAAAAGAVTVTRSGREVLIALASAQPATRARRVA